MQLTFAHEFVLFLREQQDKKTQRRRYSLPKVDLPWFVPNDQLAKKDWGWTPKFDLKRSVKRMLS
tara:strand:- start:231 stop:425 length:195 start_codon:yes stop_codon:yes gene_type:complete